MESYTLLINILLLKASVLYNIIKTPQKKKNWLRDAFDVYSKLWLKFQWFWHIKYLKTDLKLKFNTQKIKVYTNKKKIKKLSDYKKRKWVCKGFDNIFLKF